MSERKVSEIRVYVGLPRDLHDMLERYMLQEGLDKKSTAIRRILYDYFRNCYSFEPEDSGEEHGGATIYY